MMLAFALVAALSLLAVASIAVLADSGLRWWSAFGPLRAELAGSRSIQVSAVEAIVGKTRRSHIASRSKTEATRKSVVPSIKRAVA